MYIVTTGFKSMGICKTGVTGERNVCVLGGGGVGCVYSCQVGTCVYC